MGQVLPAKTYDGYLWFYSKCEEVATGTTRPTVTYENKVRSVTYTPGTCNGRHAPPVLREEPLLARV